MHRLPTGLTVRNVLLMFVCIALLRPEPAPAGQHPRLLIKADDIPRLRHACGVSRAPANTRGLGRFGERSAEFNTLRSYFSQRLGNVILPGELPAAAFLHLVDPDDPGEAERLSAINLALIQPVALSGDVLETILALDWCHEALEPAARREFLIQMRDIAKPLTPADSPLDHRVFRDNLAALALALVMDENDEPSQSWALLREHILEAAREYFKNTFPTYVRWRGLIPTGPAAAAFEENDTALAIELAGLLSGTNPWGDYRESVGRWMEHYVLVSSTHPAMQHQFLRDDGTTAPLTPAAKYEAFLPLTAHLIAARTHDPAAAYIADRVEAGLRDSSKEPAALWRWVPVVFNTREVPRVDTGRLPPARNLDGAIVLRGGDGPTATAVWIDAGQPFLRRGQHFDAGHFLIRAGGYLAVAGGDDIEFEVTHTKRGLQRLGNGRHTFDFSQYFTASIAHNCMLFWDPARVTRWYGRLYRPTGGQVPLEGTCTDFVTPLDAQLRQTAKLLAYGYEHNASYVALDLTSAYDRRAIEHYTREFIFLRGHVLVVIDRVKTANSRVVPTWILNVPARPMVAGADLAPGARTAGNDNDAGVWRHDDDQMRWQDRDGSLRLWSLFPKSRRTAIVGGPARKLLIPEGVHKGRTYIGSGPDGFEHLILPSTRPRSANAWYRLGIPTLLGPQFGIRPHWGRIEIEPKTRGDRYLFVNTLVIDKTAPPAEPDINLKQNDGDIEILISLGDYRGRISIPDSETTGGALHIERPNTLRWVFPSNVTADQPLPVR